MPGRSAPQRAFRTERGFALLIVLWTLVLIAFIVAHVTAAGRTEVQIAANLSANAAAQAAADGAIYQAIFQVSDPRPDHHWTIDGSTHELVIGKSRIMLRIEDEAGRINPNLASGALLQGLLRASGGDPQLAATVASAIAEWVGSAGTPRPPAELVAEYRAAGLDYAPPGSPLETVDELGRVRGMTADLLAALRPHLTLFGPAEPNPASADRIVAAALALAGEGASVAGPGANAGAPDLVIARIHAIAQGPGNAQVSRAAIVRIGPAIKRGYEPLAWGDTVE
jgi:general secretion pathway protein K